VTSAFGALACALVLAVVGAAHGGAAATVKPRVGGTVVIAGFDPGCLRLLSPDCDTNALFTELNQVLEGAYEITPDLTYRPNLISGVNLSRAPFRITYFIRRQARWNDGVPVTARDFVFTFNAITKNAFTKNPAVDPFFAYPYQAVQRVEAVRAKTVRVTFRSPYAPWHELFHWVLPWHALAGQDLHNVWTDAVDNPTTRVPIGDGPFVVQAYEPGRQLTLVRNTRYWGPHKAYLDRVIDRFLPGDWRVWVDALRTGEVDMIYPQVQPELATLRNEGRFAVQSIPAVLWEHISIRQVPKGNPLLAKPFVRRALAYGIDRTALVRQLFHALNPKLRPLQSGVFLPNSRFYRQNWRMYRYRPARVRRLLETNGCRRGDDGIYVCAGARLSFHLVTTAGNRFRELTTGIVQAQLRRVGIEIVPQFAPRGAFFEPKVGILASGDWDLALYASFGPPDPLLGVVLFRCHGASNDTGYCNRQVSRELLDSTTVLKPRARAALLNRADAQVARDVPLIPLYQRPNLLAFKRTIHNVADNPSFFESFTWNSEDWWIEP
jgi:peptide/nickel transport system substrate-binding protein